MDKNATVIEIVNLENKKQSESFKKLANVMKLDYKAYNHKEDHCIINIDDFMKFLNTIF